jgi:hypothetical protein
MIDFDFLNHVEDKRSSLKASTPIGSPYVDPVMEKTYVCSLGEIIGRLNPKRYLAIGGLFGTTESYAMQCCGWKPEKISIIDLDCAEYNPDRDSGAFLYSNICGTRHSGFDGQFHYHRTNSQNILQGRIGANSVMQFDCIFIDGQHDAEAVYKDISNAVWWLSNLPNSCILIHDIQLEGGDVGVGFTKWQEDHPYWHGLEIPHHLVPHGLGVLWNGGVP